MSITDPSGGGMASDLTPEPQAAPGDGGGGVAVAAKSGAKTLTCPICATTFSRRANAGKCPVCGEQVESPEASAPAVPVISPLSRWLLREGNWRIVAVVALILYEVALGILLWAHLANVRAL